LYTLYQYLSVRCRRLTVFVFDDALKVIEHVRALEDSANGVVGVVDDLHLLGDPLAGKIGWRALGHERDGVTYK
jgi:hypothetical protein